MVNMCDKQKWQWTAYIIYTLSFFLAVGFGVDINRLFIMMIGYFIAMWWTSETL